MFAVLLGTAVFTCSQQHPHDEFIALPSISELPDPLRTSDGAQVASAKEWKAQRQVLIEKILRFEYGALPPAPRNVAGKIVNETANEESRGITGYRGQEILLTMGPKGSVQTHLFLSIPKIANEKTKLPIIIVGDVTWGRVDAKIREEALQRGYILAEFDRTEIAPDSPERKGVYAAYPNYRGGRLSAWAWGYSRVIDYVCKLPFVDRKKIILTGHSRGGKATLLAGALDERVALTAPNNSGCGGAGCFRFQGENSEDISAILKNFPYWFEPDFNRFISAVDKLPFDQHTVKALVAPRLLLTTEGLEDKWANPSGTQISHDAAKKVYHFLGADNAISLVFRHGGHEHGLADWKTLLDFSDQRLKQKSGGR